MGGGGGGSKFMGKKMNVPVGELAANVSAPTVLKPKAVILLGNRLKREREREREQR